MAQFRPPEPLKRAHEKTAALHEDVRDAEANLRDSNEVLADGAGGCAVTQASVEAALVQNLQVEAQLHEAVNELQVVSDLLKVAEGSKAAAQDPEELPMAGHRSGEGVQSVLQHLGASGTRKDLGR